MSLWIVYFDRSSGAYESLRESGCLKLPSQHTLRDYTHYVKAATGFSHEVDMMLLKAAKLEVCPEREKLVLLLLDEMHIREGIVYDKHSGEMIGFANLGEINEHLLAFEHSLLSNAPAAPSPAKTMMVFMVRGLFNSLQFPYAQFPCSELTGELLYESFWDAVLRIENVGLKVLLHTNSLVSILLVQVLGATMDGNVINRRLIKMHDTTELVYKTPNPYADDGRDFFFFSDPPHLLKTIRNCWKGRLLWVCKMFTRFHTDCMCKLPSAMEKRSGGVTSQSCTRGIQLPVREFGWCPSSSLSILHSVLFRK